MEALRVEKEWPGVGDAFAIPFKKFQLCRLMIADPDTDEAVILGAEVAVMEEIERAVRYG